MIKFACKLSLVALFNFLILLPVIFCDAIATALIGMALIWGLRRAGALSMAHGRHNKEYLTGVHLCLSLVTLLRHLMRPSSGGRGISGSTFTSMKTIIIGAEADFGYAESETMINPLPGNLPSIPGTKSYVTIKANKDYGARLRAGYLIFPNLMFFSTVGVAFQEIEAIITCPGDDDFCALGATQFFSKEKTLTGWTTGVGLEAVFKGKIIPRIEYRYANLGSSELMPMTPSLNNNGGLDAKIGAESHIFLFGVAYRFW